jgi:hypothetical protein
MNFMSFDFEGIGDFEGFLGADFFGKHAVFIDFRNGRVFVKPGPFAPDSPVPPLP